MSIYIHMYIESNSYISKVKIGISNEGFTDPLEHVNDGGVYKTRKELIKKG